jgi:hypothetical protein
MSQQQQQTASKKKKRKRVHNEREQVIAQGVWLEAIFFLLVVGRFYYLSLAQNTLRKPSFFAFETSAKTIRAREIHTNNLAISNKQKEITI